MVPGIPGAKGLVGPPLDHIASRAYVAGTLRNTPDNLRAWVQHPQRIHHPSAMPEMGMSDQDARDVSAYLYTLR